MLTHSSTSVTFFFCFFFCFLFFRGKLKISLKVCVNPVKAGASVGLVFSPQLLSENQTSRSAPLRSSPKRSRQTVYQLRRALTTRSKQHHQYLNRSIMIYGVTAEKRGDGFCQTVFSPLITTSLNNGLRPVWKYDKSMRTPRLLLSAGECPHTSGHNQMQFVGSGLEMCFLSPKD